MKRFIRELRRREVFRTLGFYVGTCWLLIEVVSIVGPAFGGPDWLVRVAVILAVAGFPLVGGLAWAYDLTRHGIARDNDLAEPAAAPFGRRTDFAVIGLLSVALAVSVYLNFINLRSSGPLETLEPVSVLIADFTNDTGDSIFDGLLEQALTIGIESAPHIMAYDRALAAEQAAQLRPDVAGVPPESARLVAVREGIDLVLDGSITSSGDGFTLRLIGIDAADGSPDFDLSGNAQTREAVLAAVARLSESVRETLGDTTLERGSATDESFTAASIEAASAYMNAARLAFAGRHGEAMEQYRGATDEDPNLGRAYAGWAVSAYKVGQLDEAEELWQRALSHMNTMTERERLRTLGVYYGTIARNYSRAVETFSELVAKYPADAAARNNLAVTSFLALDFDTAAAEGRRVVEMFPESLLYRTNLALYAMYAGDFDTAATQAGLAIDADSAYGTAWLPLAVARMSQGDFTGAREAYSAMSAATASEHTAALAALGLADIAIYLGEFDAARTILETGIARDLERSEHAAAATKQIALAETYIQTGDTTAALEAARSALSIAPTEAIRTAAGRVMLEAGDLDSVAQIASALSTTLSTHAQSYGLMLEAGTLRRTGDFVDAIAVLDRALARADLWLVRYERARTYLEAGYFAEAFDDYQTCHERRGQATAVYLDDTPTYRVLAELPYWLARAQEGLGMSADASGNYRAYLEIRTTGSLALDARRRLE